MPESSHSLWSETTVGEIELLDQRIVLAVSNAFKNCIQSFIVNVISVLNDRA